MTSVCSRSLAALVMMVALAACAKPHPAQVEPPRPAVPALLASVPADAPYLVVSLDAAPPEMWARLKQVFQPLFDVVAAKWQEERGTNAVLDAVLTEMVGKWSRAGIESLGFSAQPRFAIYGLGLQPAVLRMAVKDGKAVRATIARIAAKAGKPLPPPEIRGGRSYWRHTDNDRTSTVISIADDQLIVAIGEVADIEAKLDLILGLEQPARNMADGALVHQLMARHGFGGQMIGFADTRQLGSKALEAAGATSSPACTGALDRLSAALPRLVIGYRELSGSKITGGLILEMAPDAVAELRAIQTEVPGLGAALSGHPVLAFAAGVDLARAQQLGVAVAGHLRQFGTACGLGALVNGASQVARKLSQPLPDPFERISGGAFTIDEIAFPAGDRSGTPEKMAGVLLIASPDARGLFNHTLESAPLFKRLGITADGRLHDIPIPVPMFSALAAGASDHVIVVTAGNKQRSDGDRWIGARAGGKAPLLAASYDFARIMDIGTQFRDMGPEASRPEFQRVLASMKDAFGQMSGTVDVTDHGLALWSTLEFK